GIAIFSAREEVLTPPELHLVVVLGTGIRAYQALHGCHGLIGAAEFVVGPRHLIEDLVFVLVIRVLGQQLVIERDRLEWALGICARGQSVFWRGSGGTRQDAAVGGGATLEILMRFPRTGTGERGGIIRARSLRTHEWLGRRRGSHFLRFGGARAYAELLLDFQIGETPHRFGSHRGLRCLLKEAAVVLHGLVEALLQLHVLHVGLHVVQFRQRPNWLLDTLGAADHEKQRDRHRNG